HLAVASLQLQIRIESGARAGRDLVDLAADVVEREARIAVERERGQDLRRAFAPVADHRELIVDGLIARSLALAAEKPVDEGRLARGERAEHADQRPPRDLHRERLVPIEQPEPVRDDVEAAEAADDIEEIRILALEMRREPVEMLLQRERRGFGHL